MDVYNSKPPPPPPEPMKRRIVHKTSRDRTCSLTAPQYDRDKVTESFPSTTAFTTSTSSSKFIECTQNQFQSGTFAFAGSNKLSNAVIASADQLLGADETSKSGDLSRRDSSCSVREQDEEKMMGKIWNMEERERDREGEGGRERERQTGREREREGGRERERREREEERGRERGGLNAVLPPAVSVSILSLSSLFSPPSPSPSLSHLYPSSTISLSLSLPLPPSPTLSPCLCSLARHSHTTYHPSVKMDVYDSKPRGKKGGKEALCECMHYYYYSIHVY